MVCSVRIASIRPTAWVRPTSVPVARTHSMASAFGKRLSIDMRVRPTATSSIVTRVVANCMSVFGVPSAFACVSPKT